LSCVCRCCVVDRSGQRTRWTSTPIRTAGPEGLLRQEERPSVAADRSGEIGLNPRGGGRCPMLRPLSYVPKDGGTRTRDGWIQKGSPVYATDRSLYRGIDARPENR